MIALASRLDRRAKALRAAHTLIALLELGCLGYIWACALTGRRGRLLQGSMLILFAEGAGLVVGRGKCPLGPLQERWGDRTPLFELVLPPRAAKAAVPVLAAATVGGLFALALRRHQLSHPAGGSAQSRI